jgi:hypothetical protein
MVYVTYNIPDTGLLGLFSVGHLFLRMMICDPADMLHPFPDNSAAYFQARPLTCTFSTFFRCTLDLPEKHRRQRWAPHSTRSTVSLRFPPSLPRTCTAGLVEGLWSTFLSLDGQSTLCRDFGRSDRQGLAGL